MSDADPAVPRPARAALAAWALGLAVVLVHLPAAWRTEGPIVLWDEPGYLGNARYLADGVGRTFLGYQSGYSLLLVPPAWLSDDPVTAYRLSLGVNALLAGAVPVLGYFLARRLRPDAGAFAHLVTAAVLGAYAGFAGLAGVAMSENAFVPLVLGCTLAIAVARERPHHWYTAAVLAGYASGVNARGLAVAGAFVLCRVVTAWAARRPGRALGPSLVALAVVGVARVLNRVVAGTGRVPGTADASGNFVDPVVDPGEWREVAANLFGRVSYLGVASLGLVFVGIVVAGRALPTRVRRDDGALGTVSLFALPCLLVTVAAGAISGVGFPFYRLDVLVYGRYSDAVVAPVLAIGAVTVFSAGLARRRLPAVAVAVGTAVVAGGAAVLADELYAPYYRRGPFEVWSQVNVIALQVYQSHRDLVDDVLGARAPDVPLASMLLVGAVVTFGALAVTVLDRRAGAVVTVVLLAWSSWYAHTDYVLPASRAYERQRVVPETIERLETLGVDASCVVVDESSRRRRPQRQGVVDDQTFYKFLLPETRFEARDVARAGCGPLVVSGGRGVPRRFPGAVLAARERGAFVTLWVVATRLDDDVRRRVEDELPAAGG